MNNKGFMSMGTLLFVTFAVAVTALVVSLLVANEVFNAVAPTKPEVVVTPTVAVSPTVEPTATPSASVSPLKKSTTLPVKTVTPVTSVTPSVVR